ncbi:MAG: sulfite exporter TauE/SafE family protein [Candidatus Peribacteraceae bacterium]
MSHTSKGTHTIASTYGERWALTFVAVITMGGLLLLMKESQLLAFSISNQGSLSMLAIVIVGLAASFSSCLALVGGLLLAVSAARAEQSEHLSRWRRLDPLLHFNLGRLLGYALFGGLIGLIGQSILPTPEVNGLIQVVVAIIMLWLGVRILHLLPKQFCSFPLPQSWKRALHKLATTDHVLAPSFLGAATFFVPCGFTQSMQLIALSSGSFARGATIMFLFALGTLPALLGISFASANVKGRSLTPFFLIAGSLSLILGLTGIRSGLLLTGIDIARLLPAPTLSADSDPNVSVDENDQQVISVSVSDRGYSVSRFVAEAERSTWIYAKVERELSGCLNTLVIPGYGISKPLVKGDNWIGPFVPRSDFYFMCSMGMFKANVYVK